MAALSACLKRIQHSPQPWIGQYPHAQDGGTDSNVSRNQTRMETMCSSRRIGEELDHQVDLVQFHFFYLLARFFGCTWGAIRQLLTYTVPLGPVSQPFLSLADPRPRVSFLPNTTVAQYSAENQNATASKKTSHFHPRVLDAIAVDSSVFQYRETCMLEF